MMRRLVGVGVGPGDPELITVKAVRRLREADAVLVPVLAEQVPGRAESVVRAHVPDGRVRRVVFALNDPGGLTARRTAAWDGAARVIADTFADGARTVAFATLGDPNLYSTFTYLAATVRQSDPHVEIETVAGITAMQDLAARSGTVLCEGAETLALLPLTAGVGRFRAALASHDTVVAYKGGRRLPEVLAALAEAGRATDAVFGAYLGLPGEDVRPVTEIADGMAEPVGDGIGDGVTGQAPYLSTLIVPGRRRERGGKL